MAHRHTRSSLRDPDYAARHARTSGAGGLGPRIVGPGMYDDGAADDRVRAFEGEQAVHARGAGRTRRIGVEVPQVTDMSFVREWIAVRHILRVEVSAGRRSVRSAAVSQLMDVKSMLAGSQATHLRGHLDFLRHLSEPDDTVGFVATRRVQNRNGRCDGDALLDRWWLRGTARRSDQSQRQSEGESATVQIRHDMPSGERVVGRRASSSGGKIKHKCNAWETYGLRGNRRIAHGVLTGSRSSPWIWRVDPVSTTFMMVLP